MPCGTRLADDAGMQIALASTQSAGTLMLIAGGSVSFSIGAAFMKASHGFSRPVPSAAVALLFLAGAILLSRAVMADSMSSAIVIGLGIEAVVTVLIGVTVLGDSVRAGHLLGMGLIVAGVGVLRVL